MGSVFLKFLAGAAVGLLTGLVTEPSAPSAMGDPRWEMWTLRVFLLFGVLLGGVVGALDGMSKGGAVWVWRSMGIGLLLGAIGISLGAGLGGKIVDTAFGPGWYVTGALPVRMLARTILFLCIGSFIGASIGASSLNIRKVIQGTIGGLIGGAIAGLLFDPIGGILGTTMLVSSGRTSGDVGGPSRTVSWIVLGAMVALMIGIVELVSRKAWLRHEVGRNEGKDWQLDAAQNFIGRGETCHVILRNDPQVAPVHASITKQGKHFVISDAGTPVGTYVNGHRIGQASLQPGDVIQIGSFALRFNVKGQQTSYVPHMMQAFGGQAPGQPMPQQPMPQQPMPQQPMPGQPMPGYGMPTQVMPSQPPPGYGMPTQAMPSQPMMPTGQPTVAFGASPAGSIGAPTLVAMDGPHAGRRFPVTAMIEIGREASGIALTGDANASRRHASVSPGVGGVQVNDLGSTNGTYVDGARVSTAVARPGSMIRVGSTTFRVE